MDTLPLPPRPDLEQYRTRAKSLVAAARTGDQNVVRQWAHDWPDDNLPEHESPPFDRDRFLPQSPLG